VSAFWDEVNNALRECRQHCYATRAREIQAGHRDGLHALAERCLALKEEAVAESDEHLANALLSIEHMLRAVFNELSMWIALKDDQASLAWDCLIVAQGDVRCALKAHPIGESVKRYADLLLLIEHVVFPEQLFVSPALLVDRYECSICGKEYGSCGHVVGRAYMGAMCSKVPKDVKHFRHVAIVLKNDPMDKRCRATSTWVEGQDRDTLTWRVIPEEPGSEHSPPEDGHGRLTASLLHSDQEPGS
jgi:hypothetical protein